MKKTLLIGALSLLCLGSLLAQTVAKQAKLSRKERREAAFATEQIYKSRTIGLSFRSAQNTVVTPVVYSGLGIALTSERVRIVNNKISTLNAALQYNTLRIGENSSGTTNSIALQLGKDNLKQAFFPNFYIGGMIQVNGNARIASHLGNNSIQLEIFPVLGVSSRYKRDIQLFSRTMQVEAVAKLPILGAFVGTPRYVFSGDDGQEIQFTSLHNMFNPQTQFWLGLPASKRFPNRQYRIGYEWNLNRFNRGNQNHITMGTHTLHLFAPLNKVK